ncbi:MAG: HIT domain-containing protein [Anaerolineaceae bacterium]|nr:HIT domain-containing protein [Anaerolineaceae bacterium]
MKQHPKDNDDGLFIAEMSISTLLLYREQRFHGYCLLSFSAWDATSLESLSDTEYSQFMTDVRTASKAIRITCNPDHMNYELLGNSNPHLHWHIVPRYKTDPRWGQPFGKAGLATNLKSIAIRCRNVNTGCLSNRSVPI